MVDFELIFTLFFFLFIDQILLVKLLIDRHI